MKFHYCKIDGKYIPAGHYLTDKDGNDLCSVHGQEYLEKLEARVRELEEGIRKHQMGISVSGFSTDTDFALWDFIRTKVPTQGVRDGNGL